MKGTKKGRNDEEFQTSPLHGWSRSVKEDKELRATEEGRGK